MQVQVSWQVGMTDAAFGVIWAQLLDAEQALRTLAEGQVREYVGVLEKLAHSLAPAEADARKRGDPAYFKRLTAAEWLAFFAVVQGAKPESPSAGWAAADAASPGAGPQELTRLRGELGVVQAENHRLCELLQEVRKEKAALAVALKEKGSRPAPSGARPAPEEPADEASPGPPGGDALLSAPEGLPATPPAKYTRLFGNWPVEGPTLVVMATTGWSLRQAVMRRLAEQLGVGEKDKSLRLLFTTFEERKLVQQRLEAVDGTVGSGAPDGQVHVAIVRLAELGLRVLSEIGVRTVPSEWGRLEARDGPEAVKHAAWVCAFADHARRRGYATEVCPAAERPAHADVLLTREDERIYVTVCGADQRPAWDKLVDTDGALALCAPTRQVRGDLVAVARAAGIAHGWATDLELLLSGGDRGGLWAETW